MSSQTHTIEVDEFLAHPAARVWEALINPTELAQWFMATDFRPESGHEFTLDVGRWGTVHCKVAHVEAERLLRYTWRNGPLDTVVTWHLVPEGKGTRVILEHESFDLSDPVQRQAFNGMTGGWRSMVLTSLARHLAGPDSRSL